MTRTSSPKHLSPQLLSGSYAGRGAVRMPPSSAEQRGRFSPVHAGRGSVLLQRAAARPMIPQKEEYLEDVVLLQRMQVTLGKVKQILDKAPHELLSKNDKKLQEKLNAYFSSKTLTSAAAYQEILDLADQFFKDRKKPKISDEYSGFAKELSQRFNTQTIDDAIQSKDFQLTIQSLQRDTVGNQGFIERAKKAGFKKFNKKYTDQETKKMLSIFLKLYISDMRNDPNDVYKILESETCMKHILQHNVLPDATHVQENDALITEVNDILKSNAEEIEKKRPEAPRGKGKSFFSVPTQTKKSKEPKETEKTRRALSSANKSKKNYKNWRKKLLKTLPSPILEVPSEEGRISGYPPKVAIFKRFFNTEARSKRSEEPKEQPSGTSDGVREKAQLYISGQAYKKPPAPQKVGSLISPRHFKAAQEAVLSVHGSGQMQINAHEASRLHPAPRSPKTQQAETAAYRQAQQKYAATVNHEPSVSVRKVIEMENQSSALSVSAQLKAAFPQKE